MSARLMVATVLAVTLAACGEPASNYAPVPDRQLFEQIKEIPGVVRSHLAITESEHSWGGTPSYGGQIFIAGDADPLAILDQVLAILWQGKPDAGYGGVRVILDTKSTDVYDVGLTTPQEFEARYGPQPGTGKPPKDRPPLKLIE